MNCNIKVRLLPGWIDASKDNPHGPPTFVRESSKCSGALQVSQAEYVRGAVPNPSERDLIEMSRTFGMNFGDIVESQSGGCKFGKFGMTVYRSAETPHSQVWYLSDGKDFIMVTHLCGGEEPDPQELIEVNQIVRMLTLGPPNKPWWRFW